MNQLTFNIETDGSTFALLISSLQWAGVKFQVSNASDCGKLVVKFESK